MKKENGTILIKIVVIGTIIIALVFIAFVFFYDRDEISIDNGEISISGELENKVDSVKNDNTVSAITSKLTGEESINANSWIGEYKSEDKVIKISKKDNSTLIVRFSGSLEENEYEFELESNDKLTLSGDPTINIKQEDGKISVDYNALKTPEVSPTGVYEKQN